MAAAGYAAFTYRLGKEDCQFSVRLWLQEHFGSRNI